MCSLASQRHLIQVCEPFQKLTAGSGSRGGCSPLPLLHEPSSKSAGVSEAGRLSGHYLTFLHIYSLFAYLFLNAAKTDVEFYEDQAGLKLLAIPPSTGVIGMHHQTQVGFFCLVWFLKVVALAAFQCRDPPASDSQVLGLKVYARARVHVRVRACTSTPFSFRFQRGQ